MRSLADLLASPGGRDFLRGRGVLTDPAEFLARLRPTASDGARPWLDSSSDAPPVYAGQQLQCDYPRPVAAKFEALRDLARSGDVTPVAVWLDTDRAGASKASTTLTWPGDGEQSSQRLVPQRFDDLEVRFVPTERKRLDAAAARLGAWTEAAAGDAGLSERSRARLRELVAELLRDDVHTLAQTNLAISTWLLRELGFEPCPVRVSDLAECGVLAVAVDDVVARIDDFVAAFNAAVEELRARDVDPQVPPLDPRYLPLRYSCPRDGARRRMTRERRGADHFAVAACRCGAEYRFHLGSTTLSIDELAATRRWSVDVTLPAYLNDHFSGAVVGRSSALYGLVLNATLEKVLRRHPIPVLIPPELQVPSGRSPEAGLVYRCLTAP